MQKVIHGNNIDVLKSFPDNHFDAVVTDPPYGLGKEPDAAEVMQAWVSCGYHEIKGSGFMGKEWDAFVPQPLFWKEVYRVLKHGGHVLSFFGTRTYDWGVMAMRFAGFEVRDCIQWIYGSGFPKSHNIGKAIDKIEGNERQFISINPNNRKNTESGINLLANRDKGEITLGNTKWEGWGSALKPANEPIVLARKPLEKGLSIAENVLKWGTGGINIDGCRVSFKDDADFKESTTKNQHADFGTAPMTNNQVYGDWSMIQPQNYQPTGRFPANIILTHHPECECKGMKKVKGTSTGNGDAPIGKESLGVVKPIRRGKFTDRTDENGEEEIEDWNCHPDCPIRIMDEQSGVLKSGDLKPYKNKIDAQYSQFHSEERNVHFRGDSGGASRFFYCAKASKSERNNGLDGFEQKIGSTNHNTSGRDIGRKQFCQICNKRQGACKCITPDFSNQNPNKRANTHPTVKPVKLMQYLVRLVTPPNGLVLDPFAGSGTTGIAAKLEGISFIGIEQDPEYCKIAEARIQNFLKDREEQKEINNNSTSDKDENTNLEGFQQLSLF